MAVLGLAACSAEGGRDAPRLDLASSAASDAGGVQGTSGGEGASDGGNATDEASGFGMPPENEGLLPPDRANYPGIDTETDEGAQQTVKFFFDAMYYGYATGDTEPLESVSSKNCVQCTIAIDDIRERAEVEGAFLVGHSVEDERLTVAPSERAGQARIYYAYIEGATTKYYGDGRVEEFPARRMHSAAHLAFTVERWSITEIGWAENRDE